MTSRHTICFHLPPSSSKCSSSCSKACPRLNTRCSWARSSIPSFRRPIHPSIFWIYLSIDRSIHRLVEAVVALLYLIKQGCPPCARVAGGGSGARRKDHWHAARSGRAPDQAPQRAPDRSPHYLPRHGALIVARQPLACTRPHLSVCAPCGVPQLLNSIKEAQGVLECTHFDGGDRSDSLNPDGAESADGFEARARAYSNRAFFRDEPFPQTILFARRRH